MEILGGPLYAVAGAGESHGPAVTTIVFGCPPGLLLRAADIQYYLDRRRPGSNRHGTPRREDDSVALLSGLYQADVDLLTSGPELRMTVGDEHAVTTTYAAGYTTGEPIAAIVLTTAKKSADYAQFTGTTGEVRPGHTDLVKFHKTLGHVDVRGGGRSSYRSTISDVIGGSIARLLLAELFGVAIFSSIVQVGPLQSTHSLAEHLEALHHRHAGKIPPGSLADLEKQLTAAEIHAYDADFARAAGELIKQTRIDGDSLGAAVEVVAVNVPALVGDPLYQSLKLRIMGSLGGLNAVQGVEIGAGFAVVAHRGSENNDPILAAQGYQRNSHGGLIGGITTGMPLVFRAGFKPTSTIVKPQLSVRKNLEEIDFQLRKGRHDPCVGVRAGVTLESRVAIELMNAVLMHQAMRIDPAQFRLFDRGQTEPGA